MCDCVRDVPHAVHELLDLIEHAIDSARERVQLVRAVQHGKPMAQITLHDGLHRVAKTVHADQDRPPDHQAAQDPCAQQHQDGGGQTVPEAGRQRLEQRLVPADQQVIAAWQQGMREHRMRRLAGQVHIQRVRARPQRNGPRPLMQVPSQRMHRGVREQQNSLTGDLHSDTRIDECRQAPRTVVAEDFRQAVCVRAQQLRTPVLDRHLPGIPQWRSKQDERRHTEGDVADGQRERGRLNESIHRLSACNRRCAPCAARDARTPIRSSDAIC